MTQDTSLRQITRKSHLGISKHVLWHTSLPFDYLILQVCLGSDYIEGIRQMDYVELFERVVSPVEYVISIGSYEFEDIAVESCFDVVVTVWKVGT